MNDSPEARASADATPRPLAAPAPAPVAAGLGLLWPAFWVLLLVAVLVGMTLGTGRWLLMSEDGARWLLARLPGVEASGVKGSPLGETLSAERLRVQWAGGSKWLLIEGFHAQGLRWQWRPEKSIWVGLSATHVAARKLELHTGPASPPPKDMLPPLRVILGAAEVDTLVVDGHAVQALKLRRLVVDGRPGQQHGVEQFQFTWDGNAVQGKALLANVAPMALEAQASLVPHAQQGAPPWAAVVNVTGVLERMAVQVNLRSVPRAGFATPSLDLHASVLPFAAWPLSALTARTEALDLAALSPQAPQTRLSGSAEILSKALDAPISARIRIDNARPGRWDQGRVPLRRIELDLGGLLQQRERLTLSRFELQLADDQGAAGRWSGSGVWDGHGLEFSSQLHQVTPQRLDGRAAAMTLSGALNASLKGLPSPDPAAAAPTQALALTWQAALDGRLDAAPQTVRLELEGQARAGRVELRRLRAQAGSAVAELQATLERQSADLWRLESAGQLKDFDPRPWWPGEAASAWRQGVQRYSADWQFELRAPQAAARLAPLALLQSLAGNGQLRLHDSVLAGVPVQAELTLAHRQGSTPHPGTLRLDLRLGGNQLLVDGRGDPSGNGSNDLWRAEIKADELATLAPLTQLHPALKAWALRRGSMEATVTAAGRWPQLRSEGRAQLQRLAAGNLSLTRGQATWQWEVDAGTGTGTGSSKPLALQLELGGLQRGTQRVEQLSAALRGTLASHRIEVHAALPTRLPDVARELLALPLQPGTRAQLLADGRWQAEPGGGGRWRAEVEQLSLAGWDGKAPSSAASEPWADARKLRAELLFNPQGQLATLTAEPGRVHLAKTLTLRWDAVRVDMLPTTPHLVLRADLEPFLAAPLLMRLQPRVGWGGDLRLGARMEIKASERFDADFVLERLDGDLHVTDGDGVQLLGLSEARLALSAHDGIWDLSPAFNGRSLGEVRGKLRVRSTPERRWPSDQAPIEGSISAHVAHIGVWSNWVPPGWRLSGEVKTVAQISGRFGDPQYTGEVKGSGLAVRNLLQGVHVTDGQVSLRLDGDVARVELFTLRAGEGKLSITGGATLGSQPRANLRLVAERFRVLGRVDRLLIASGEADMVLLRDQLKLDGSLRVDEALFDASRADAPSLDDDVTVRKSGDAAWQPSQEATPGPRRNIQVGLDIDLGDKTRVRGRGLDTSLRGKLRLTTPGGRPALSGIVYAERGTYQAYGQKLEIERGILSFNGPLDNPRLDVLALRPKIDTRVGVSIGGNLQLPRVRLYSDPELSETEKLSWLVLGRASDGLGRADTALLQRAAVALLAGEGEAPTDGLLRKLGIDEISLRQGDGEVRETVVSLGKQLSSRWYLGYERGVNATTGTWQLIYRIAQRFTLRAQSGLDNSVDIIWVKRLDEAADAGVRKSIAIPP